MKEYSNGHFTCEKSELNKLSNLNKVTQIKSRQYLGLNQGILISKPKVF